MGAATAALARLPCRTSLALGRIAADLATRLGARRRPMRENLDLVFGSSRSDAQKRAIARSAMRNLFLSVLESLRASHPRARGEMAGLVRFEPMALIEELARDERPVVFAVAHSGNFELAGLAFAEHTGRQLAVVMKPLRHASTTRVLVKSREALGFRVFGTWDSAVLRQAIRHLRAGGVLCMLPDQYARRIGVVLPFLGHPASTHTGPAFAALKAPGTRVIVAVDLRIDDGERHLCRIEEIEDFTPTGETRADVAALTRRINDAMGRMIEKAPESYLWQHRRWRVPGRLRDASGRAAEPGLWVTPPQKRTRVRRSRTRRS